MTEHISAISPERFSVRTTDGELAGWRWPSEGAPPLLFCHATGFCASAYKQMLQRLSGAHDIFALDMRGHGRTRLPADPKCLRSWSVYAEDIAGFLDGQKRGGWILAGHSMGGVTVAKAARSRTDIAALALIEPVTVPALFSLAAHTPIWPVFSGRIPMVRQAAKRRARWEDPQRAFASYARKPVFADWADGVLADYLEDGLRADEDGGVALSCSPAWEAATFAAQANDFWGAMQSSRAQTSVLAAQQGASTVRAYARKRLAKLGVPLTEIAELSHLAPMQDPARCAAFVAEAAHLARKSSNID